MEHGDDHPGDTEDTGGEMIEYGSARRRFAGSRHAARWRTGLVVAALLVAGGTALLVVNRDHGNAAHQAITPKPERTASSVVITLTPANGYQVDGNYESRSVRYQTALVNGSPVAVQVKYSGQALPSPLTLTDTSGLPTTIARHGAVQVSLEFAVETCARVPADTPLRLQARPVGASTWQPVQVSLFGGGANDSWTQAVFDAACPAASRQG